MSERRRSDAEESGHGSWRVGIPGIARRYKVPSVARGYQVGFEAVAAVGLAVGIGAWIDSRYGTGPVFLLVGTVVGLGACVLRLVRYQRAQDAREREASRNQGQGTGP
jgi:F0F1-type ATP synthase assembly protein I